MEKEIGSVYTEGEGTVGSCPSAPSRYKLTLVFMPAEVENEGPQFLVDHLQY